MRSMTCSDLKKFLPRLPRRKTILVGLAVLVCAVLTLLWQLEQVTFAQIITASVGGLGLYVGLRQLRATEKNTSVAQDNVRVAQEGHLTKGFTQAVEHLGHSSGSVRLSGAYELFHLARDTPDFRQSVLDILCAHIRQTTREPEYRKDYKRNPSEEIQSLLALLFVQEHEVFTECDINLQGSCLNRSNLGRARLEKANLRRAQLHGANLMDAQLHGARLDGAHLHGASLWGAQLHGAELGGAHMHGAELGGAHMHGARLVGAQLYGAYLVGAQLYGASLWGAQLHGAHLTEAQLHEVSLVSAQLHGASSEPGGVYSPFETVINERIGEPSDLSEAIFDGGLTREAVASIGKGLPDEHAKRLRAKLEAHIGKPASHELPKNSGASIGAYTKEEARGWIASFAYEKALPAVPEIGLLNP